ncbi:MAG: SH3 domain-containing protein [bacterium]|nr:SH3 domain-containing protein [bacterium]
MSAPVFDSWRARIAGILLAGFGLPGLSAPAWADENRQALPATAAATTENPLAGAPGFFDLQVLSAHIAIHEEPAEDSSVLADIRRGQMLRADQRRGDWYRIRFSDAVDGAYGWIRQAPGEDGDMRLSVQAYGSSATQNPADSTPGTGEDALASAEIQRSSVDSRRMAIGLPLIDPAQVAPPQADLPREMVAIPDRWRIMQALGFRFPLYDPYHQNPLKGDLPVLPALGDDWFFNLGLIADTTYEMRRLPIPVAPQTSPQAGALNVFGDSARQSTLTETLVINLGLIKGDTTFKPPEYEFRFVPVLNYNRSEVDEPRALRVDPRSGEERRDHFAGIQELFADVHLRNVSERYDFDSVRVGIQPMNLDFRGFLFQDNALGVRFFGNRDNNHWQYNAGWMRRLEKDTNSGLNDPGRSPRRDDVYFANAYRQDFPVAGFTSQLALVHNRNAESGADYYDKNGFQVRPAVIGDVRPHDYQVTYLGYSGDGHLSRYGLSTSTYLALGHDDYNAVAQKSQTIEAFFHATELSRDFDWIRLRGNFLYASGDRNPFDNVAGGFDAILENPQFAGADTSFFIRQAVPLIGGGGVALSGRNGILPSLRSSKDQGQSNFVNPGLTLLGAGADLDLTPTLRLLGNVSALRFNETQILGVLRNQLPPSKDIGTDVSAGIQYRPLYSQNIVITGSFAALVPGKGLRELYDEDQRGPQYSALINVILAF